MTTGAAKKVFFAVPTLSSISPQTCHSLIQAMIVCHELGWAPELHFRQGDSIIPQARNVLVGMFLQSDCTDLVFVDSDVGFDFHAFTRLMTAPVDFVAGVYRHKKDDESYPIGWLDKPELWADPETGLLEVKEVPMGFTRLTRRMIEKMCGHYSDRTFTTHDFDGPCWCLFDLELENGRYRGEDFVFCKRWRGIGGQVWIDPLMELSHIGSKAYSGTIGTWLRNRGNE